jgi:Tol biopolymer transport system component
MLVGVVSLGALGLGLDDVISTSPMRGRAAVSVELATFAAREGYIALARRQRGIFLVDPDGGGERRLAATRLGGVACSPDGSWLAFVRERADSHRGDDIYRVAVSGGGPKRLTNTRGAAETQLVWSSDARRIVYGSGALIGSHDLWVMNTDGSGKRRITHRVGDEVSPTWSPSSRRIAFAASGTRSRRGGIFVAPIAGGTLSRLTRGPALADDPDWSVRNRIAYERWRRGISTLYAVNPDGGEKTRLARVRGSTNQIVWSPDGRRLAFDVTVPGVSDSTMTGIYVVEADGTGLRRLTDELADANGPAWSPDGTRIAFTSNWDVWVMNADGTGQQRLTRDPASESVGCWQPPQPRRSISTKSGSRQALSRLGPA